MFYDICCSLASVQARSELIYAFTYLLGCVNVHCGFGLASQEENTNYLVHESEGPLSALRQAREKKTRG